MAKYWVLLTLGSVSLTENQFRSLYETLVVSFGWKKLDFSETTLQMEFESSGKAEVCIKVNEDLCQEGFVGRDILLGHIARDITENAFFCGIVIVDELLFAVSVPKGRYDGFRYLVASNRTPHDNFVALPLYRGRSLFRSFS